MPATSEFLALRQTTHHFYGRLFEPLLASYDLTQMAMDVLLFLANNPEYDTARDLVAVRQLSKSHVSSTVDSLVRRGWLARTPDSRNARIQHLTIQPAAKDAVAAGQQIQQHFFDILLKGIPADERQAFFATAEKIVKNARRACAEK